MAPKIRFTPEAARQAELFANLDTVQTGFATGSEIGKFVIIEHLLPVDFDEKNIDRVYPEALANMGDKLKGLFFKGDRFFKSDWFLGDIIIKIEKIGSRSSLKLRKIL